MRPNKNKRLLTAAKLAHTTAASSPAAIMADDKTDANVLCHEVKKKVQQRLRWLVGKCETRVFNENVFCVYTAHSPYSFHALECYFLRAIIHFLTMIINRDAWQLSDIASSDLLTSFLLYSMLHRPMNHGGACDPAKHRQPRDKGPKRKFTLICTFHIETVIESWNIGTCFAARSEWRVRGGRTSMPKPSRQIVLNCEITVLHFLSKQNYSPMSSLSIRK